MKMRGVSGAIILLFLSFAPIFAQEQNQDEINPAILRRFWLGASGPQVAASPYELTSAERKQHGGTFGLDLSHYTFDTANDDPKCKTAAGYTDEGCSCSIEWRKVYNSGVRFVYLKASDGLSVDLSFKRAWSELAPHHREKRLLRGAYHFLRPGRDPESQAETFLAAIGSTSSRSQLPPVLDIEWSNKRVDGEELKTCPPSRRITIDKGDSRTHYCDMWHTTPPSEIVSMAKRWIERVEAATGQRVIIYTNPTGWWNVVMSSAEAGSLLADRAVWTSRYTARGPEYNSAWDRQGGSSKWKMAPIPRGAKFPIEEYNVPHIWQFTETGYLPSPVLYCAGEAQKRYMDVNWIPVSELELAKLFEKSR